MIKVTIHDYDEDSDREVEFPSVMEVCGECEGHGMVLAEGLRGYAFSSEEFHESFDEEEAHEYFTRGGRYDVQCPSCKGLRVVAVVNEAVLTPEQREEFELYQEQQSEIAEMDRADRATMRMESGCWDG